MSAEPRAPGPAAPESAAQESPPQESPPDGVAPPFSAGYARDPHPTHAWLQDDAPLYRDPASRMLLVSRHADCAALLRHDGVSAAGGQADRRRRGGVPHSMLTTDGAVHAALRRPAALLLGPGPTAELVARVAPALDARLDALAAAGTPVDLTPGLAEPLATDVMAALLGLPVGDREAVETLDTHARAVAIALDPVPRPDVAFRAHVLVTRFGAYLSELVGRAVDGPADGPLGRLVHDGRLDPAEVVGVLQLAVVGGWAPIAEVTTSALLATLADPRLLAAAATPDGAAGVVEEVLRWHTPIPFVARTATEDVAVPSGSVPAGTMLLLLLGAANRDPRAFPDPHRVVPGRVPRGQLGFGAGPHFCLGAPLVRAVVALVLQRLFTRFPGTRCADTADTADTASVRWLPGIFPRRVASRAVHVTAGS